MTAEPASTQPTQGDDGAPSPQPALDSQTPVPLAALLPTHADADRPWLVWYSPTERVELTGHVLAMWASKVAGFLAEQAPPTPVVELATHGSWRGIVWALGTWMAGGCVRDAALRTLPQEPGGRLPEPADVSVALEVDALDADAELQVLLPSASLAVRWDGAEPLPALVVDGVADLMAYSDHYPGIETDESSPALVSLAFAMTPGRALEALDAPITPVTWPQSRESVRAQAFLGASALRGQAGGRPRAVVVRAEEPAGASEWGDQPERGKQPASAGQSAEDVNAIEGVLAAWAAGACAVLMSADASPDLIATAARQEQALLPDDAFVTAEESTDSAC